MNRAVLSLALLLSVAIGAQEAGGPPAVLPARAVDILAASLKAASGHAPHVWRDTPSVNADGTVNAYIEIARGDRRKWEFDMSAQTRALDRVIPVEIGGYPVNYGFVPQTVSYDGDPFDALVLGPPLPGGEIVRGVAVGLLSMEDDKGLDSKVVLSLTDAAGQPMHALTAEIRNEIADYFGRYKSMEPGGFSKVSGWGTASLGLEFVRTTHMFFEKCTGRTSAACTLPR
ncbi:MAG TPA: inorganic diphosphatase [Terriglobia bacterium]|nr:inorganic diphosphatase [Terriglobia bacterium]